MVSYAKHKRMNKYFLECNSLRTLNSISNELDITFEQLIETIELCGGKFSSSFGWFFIKEEQVINCCILLNMSK